MAKEKGRHMTPETMLLSGCGRPYLGSRLPSWEYGASFPLCGTRPKFKRANQMASR